MIIQKRKSEAQSQKQSAKGSISVPTGARGRVRRKASEAEVAKSGANEPELSTVCINCGGELLFIDEARLCPKCNTEASIEMIHVLSAVVLQKAELDSGFIECPGATLIDAETGDALEGAIFREDSDSGYSVKHVKWPVFPPEHKKRRMIPTEAFGKIRRCRACQDYTVRMRRREGADFCAPSSKFPKRKRLKSVDIVSHRQSL